MKKVKIISAKTIIEATEDSDVCPVGIWSSASRVSATWTSGLSVLHPHRPVV